MKKNPALGANWRSWRSEDRSVQCPVLKSSVIHRVLCPVNGIEELKKRHLEFHSSVIHSILRPVPENSVIHCPISSTLKTVKKTTKISYLNKVDPSQDQEKSYPEEGLKEKVSSPKELSDTLDLARSFKTIRRDASISGQEVTKKLDSVLQRNLKRSSINLRLLGRKGTHLLLEHLTKRAKCESSENPTAYKGNTVVKKPLIGETLGLISVSRLIVLRLSFGGCFVSVSSWMKNFQTVSSLFCLVCFNFTRSCLGLVLIWICSFQI